MTDQLRGELDERRNDDDQRNCGEALVENTSDTCAERGTGTAEGLGNALVVLGSGTEG